jgi:O-antigen ligase
MKILKGTGPELVLYGLLFMAWIVPENVYLRVGVVVRPLDVAIVLFVLVFLLVQFKNGRLRAYGSGILVVFGVFILWGFVSVIWAGHKTAVIVQSIQWLEMLLILILLSSSLRTEEHLRQFVLLLLFFAIVNQIILLARFMPVLLHTAPYVRERPDPFFSAILIAMLAGYLAEREYVMNKLLMVALILLSSVNMLFSLTRKGIIGCALSLCIIAVLSSRSYFHLFRKTLLYAGTGLFLFIMVSASVPELGARLSDRFKALALQGENLTPGVEGRITDAFASYNIFKEHPLVGLGLGNHQFESGKYFVQLFEKETIEKSGGIHNGFLQILSELGLVGMIVLLVLYGKAFGLMKLYRRHRNRVRYPGMFLGIASLLPIVAIRFATTHSGAGQIFPLVFILVLTIAYQRILKGREEAP